MGIGLMHSWLHQREESLVCLGPWILKFSRQWQEVKKVLSDLERRRQ